MKKLTILILLLGTGYASAAEFSGNVTLATDYRFRGISQLDRSPALQLLRRVTPVISAIVLSIRITLFQFRSRWFTFGAMCLKC